MSTRRQQINDELARGLRRLASTIGRYREACAGDAALLRDLEYYAAHVDDCLDFAGAGDADRDFVANAIAQGRANLRGRP